jgi:hypothetical protein
MSRFEMEPLQLIEKYRRKGLLLDTNLMVLLVIGSYRRERILSFERTDRYSVRDFEILMHVLAKFERHVTTPHILTETDNLTRQLGKLEHRALAAVMTRLLAKLFEIHVPSKDASASERYAAFGLTDCSTLAVTEDVLFITDDFSLSQVLSHLGRTAVNFNHIRTLYPKQP